MGCVELELGLDGCGFGVVGLKIDRYMDGMMREG